MNELKVGDKVEIVIPGQKGKIGKIIGIRGSHPIIYRVQIEGKIYPFVRSELQKAR